MDFEKQTNHRYWLAYDWRTWLPSRGNVIFTLLVVTLAFWAQSVGALPGASPTAAPQQASTDTIAYQGRLTDAAGNPLTGTYDMAFRLYDASTGGTLLWEEQSSGGVQVSDGLFNVMLGSQTPITPSIFADYDSLFLGVVVGSEEMSGRVQLGSVPFAMQALTVADGSITSDKIADGAVTLQKMGLAKYRFSTNNQTGGQSVIHYREASLDVDTCLPDTWCCNAEETLCYYPRSSGNSILEFSLNGAPSITCTLLHSEDDSPNASKGFHYATDNGNGCHMNNQCVRLSKDGVSGNPISLNAAYYWLCGW